MRSNRYIERRARLIWGLAGLIWRGSVRPPRKIVRIGNILAALGPHNHLRQRLSCSNLEPVVMVPLRVQEMGGRSRPRRANCRASRPCAKPKGISKGWPPPSRRRRVEMRRRSRWTRLKSSEGGGVAIILCAPIMINDIVYVYEKTTHRTRLDNSFYCGVRIPFM
jgi:hypothetical protein